MRLFSEMIIFVVVCLAMLSIIYGFQDAFLPDGTSAGIRWQSQVQILVPLHSWGFTQNTELPSAPAAPPPGRISPRCRSHAPRVPGLKTAGEGDAFFDAKFRNL